MLSEPSLSCSFISVAEQLLLPAHKVPSHPHTHTHTHTHTHPYSALLKETVPN